MFKFKTMAFLILTVFCTAGFSEEGEPISLFQIDFDLTADSAFELAAARFKCDSQFSWNSNGNKYCDVNGSTMVSVNRRANDLAAVDFYCSTFNGCGYSSTELKESLSQTKMLVFEENCAAGGLGEEVCVSGEYESLKIIMNRAKFRAKNLSFD